MNVVFHVIFSDNSSLEYCIQESKIYICKYVNRNGSKTIYIYKYLPERKVMPSTDLVGQLYDILEQVKCLRDENCQLRAELKHQEIRHRREIELISRRQQSVVDVEKEKGEEVVGEEEEGYRIYQEEPREDENPFVYEEPNLNLQLNVSNIPNLSYTPLTPKKRIKIKQEPYEELSVPLIERFNGPTVPKFTAAKEDSNLIKRDAYIDDSEFARLPTQYSDQSNSPLKSQKFSFSPIKFQESSPVKVPALEDDSIEVIDDSDIEYDLLVKPRNEEEKDRVKVKQEPGVIMKRNILSLHLALVQFFQT